MPVIGSRRYNYPLPNGLKDSRDGEQLEICDNPESRGGNNQMLELFDENQE